MERVAAITVTYNRTSTLKRCLEALLAQSRPVDVILVVDNNSRDEEKEKLRELASGQEMIQILWLKDNLGGAGGFEAGMDRARREYAPDWYWIMDDDAYPREDCLEKLLESGKKLPEAGCLAPLIYGVDLKEYQLYHHKRLSGLIFKNIPIAVDYKELKDENPIEANAFVGPLFSKDAVETVGIADGSLFIYGDDTEYTYRVSRVKKAYLIKEAVIDHQDPPLLDHYMQPEAWWKDYYSKRNQYFMIREFQTVFWKRVLADFCLTVPILKLVIAALLKAKYRGLRRLRASLLMKAVRDGIGNKRGKTLDPAMYNAYLKGNRGRSEHP